MPATGAIQNSGFGIACLNPIRPAGEVEPVDAKAGTRLLFDLPVMEVVQRRRQDDRGERIEHNHVEVRMSFHQSNHRVPLHGWCGFLFPAGRASMGEKLGAWVVRR